MPLCCALGAKYRSPRSRENWLILTCPHACCIDRGVRFTVKGVDVGSGGDIVMCVPTVCPAPQLLNSKTAHKRHSTMSAAFILEHVRIALPPDGHALRAIVHGSWRV